MAKSVKDSIKEGIVPKGNKPVKSTGTTKTKKAKQEVSNTVADITSKLPDAKKAVYITAREINESKPIKVSIDDIKATSQYIHVNDIHSANPEILAKVYYIIMPNTNYVVLRLAEKDYNELLTKSTSKRINHLYSVVDHAVFPSLTYGSWKLNEIAGELPDADQVADYDDKFKKMDIHVHNQPVHAVLDFVEEEDLDIDFSEDEDDVDIDFSDGDDELTDEEDEFDFSEED